MATGINKGLSYGAGGLAAGSAFGPIGAAIGGIGGLVGGLLSGDDSTAARDAATAAGANKLQNIGEATRIVQEQRAKMAALQMQQLNNRMANYQGANNVLASMYGGGGAGARPAATIPTQQNQASMGSILQGPAFDKLQQMIPRSIPTQQNQASMGTIGGGPALGRLGQLMPDTPAPQAAQAAMGSIRQGPTFGGLQGGLLTPDILNAAAQQAAMGTIMGGPGQAAPPPPSALAQSGILQGLGGGIRRFG